MAGGAGDQARRADPDEPLPEWLWAELTALLADFDHLPERARYEAMKRNLSARAHAHFDALAERRVRDLGEGEGEGAF